MKSKCASLVLLAGLVFTTGARGQQVVVIHATPTAGPGETLGLWGWFPSDATLRRQAMAPAWRGLPEARAAMTWQVYPGDGEGAATASCPFAQVRPFEVRLAGGQGSPL